MPRTARKKSESGIYHIILRGINKQTIFEEEEDSITFLETLGTYKEKSGYKVFAYCLMGNHIHLLLKEENEELGIVMRRIGASYVYWYNEKYGRCGHLFQDRYKSEPVENEKYLLTVLRYIHQNPLKAGVVKDVASYRWSSYWEYVGGNQTSGDSSYGCSKTTETSWDSSYGCQKQQPQKPSPMVCQRQQPEKTSQLICDVDYVLGLFDEDREKAMDSFKEFHEINSDDKFMDIDEKRRITDKEAIDIIKKTCHVVHCTDIQGFERDKRDRCLKALKKKGLSMRQIARLTGVSRGIIMKL